jgi:hypothetical protein
MSDGRTVPSASGYQASIQPGDRSALKRWLSELREEGAIAPAVPPPLTSHDRIFDQFDADLRTQRGLAPKSIVRHLPVIRRFLHEVCPAGDDDLGKISQEEVIRYIERTPRIGVQEQGRRCAGRCEPFSVTSITRG